MHQPTPPRLAVSVQTIRNPLTRAAYGLRTGAAHLLVLQSGAAQLRSEGDLAATEAPRLAWWPDGGGRECVVEPGSRGTLVSIPEILLLHGIPATPLGDHMRRTLAQRLSLALSPDLRIAPLLDNLAQERASALPGGEVAETHILGLLLIQLWRAARADLLDHGHSPQGLAERFVQLASRHRLEHRTVADAGRSGRLPARVFRPGLFHPLLRAPDRAQPRPLPPPRAGPPRRRRPLLRRLAVAIASPHGTPLNPAIELFAQQAFHSTLDCGNTCRKWGGQHDRI